MEYKNYVNLFVVLYLEWFSASFLNNNTKKKALILGFMTKLELWIYLFQRSCLDFP